MSHRKPSPLPLRERLHALAGFLPQFEERGFTFGQWVPPLSKETDALIIGYFRFSETADAFLHMAYNAGWVLFDFDWGKWVQTPEAGELRDNPKVLAGATADQLAKLLTVVIRQERFCEGSLEAAFESGLLTGIVRRAAQLETQLDEGGS